VPCGPINHPLYKILDDPQVVRNGVVVEATHPHAGEMRFARPAARFEGDPFGVRRHAPLTGEHSGEVLGELGFSRAEIDEMRARGWVHTGKLPDDSSRHQ